MSGGSMSLDDKWLSTEAAAELSGYHVNYIRRLIRQGEIEGRKWGPAWMVNRPSLLDYLEKSEKLGGKRGPKRKKSD